VGINFCVKTKNKVNGKTHAMARKRRSGGISLSRIVLGLVNI